MNKKEILSEIKKIEIVIRKRLSGNSAGFYLSAYKGIGMELEGVKEYSYEDDFRFIDWNAFARTGRPFTLVMQEERELELYLLVDVSASMAAGGSLYPELQSGQSEQRIGMAPAAGAGDGAEAAKSAVRKTKLETAAIAAAVLGLSAASSRDKTAAILFSGEVEETVLPAAGRSHIFSIAEKILDSHPTHEGSNLEVACRALPRSFRKKGICIIISDMEYDIPWQTLLKISSGVETAIFRIRDNADTSTKSPNSFSYESRGNDPYGYFYSPAKRKPRASEDTWPSKEASKKLRQHTFYSPAGLRSIPCPIKNTDKDFSEAAKFEIPLVDISTSDNIVEKINTFFNSRKR
ncbi:MAG: DUF58 domain-containing protein [Spirochaetes bacterium]|nr:DUF58 domain-containing protein [Spirochaetota bacterium]